MDSKDDDGDIVVKETVIISLQEWKEKKVAATIAATAVKVTLMFSPAAAERFSKIKTGLKIADSATAVKSALKLVEWFLDHKEENPLVRLTKKVENGEDEIKYVELVLWD